MARGWRYTKTLSIECPYSIFFWHVVHVIIPLFFSGMWFVLLFLSSCCFCFVFVFVFVSMPSLELVDVPLIFLLSSRPRTGLATTYITGMIEAQSVSGNKTHTHT